MRGRKPKPVELRVLHGGAAEKAREALPRPRRVLPRCPAHLCETAKAKWREMAGDLYDAGLLTAIDRDALAAYCDAYARWVDAKGKVDGAGAILKSADGGYYQNPFLSVANKAMEQMLKIGSEFGMTPSSRTRVRAEVSAAKEQARAVPPRRQTSAAITGGDDPRRALSND